MVSDGTVECPVRGDIPCLGLSADSLADVTGLSQVCLVRSRCPAQKLAEGEIEFALW